MESLTLIIVVVTVVLTILLVVLGIQVFFILKEIRLGLQKMNTMLDDMAKVTGTVSEGVTNMGGIFSGMKAGFSIFSSLLKRREHDE